MAHDLSSAVIARRFLSSPNEPVQYAAPFAWPSGSPLEAAKFDEVGTVTRQVVAVKVYAYRREAACGPSPGYQVTRSSVISTHAHCLLMARDTTPPGLTGLGKHRFQGVFAGWCVGMNWVHTTSRQG